MANANRTTTRNRINKGFSARIASYENEVPMSTIMEVVAEHGGMCVDEAGDKWSGFFCGADGQASIEVKFQEMKSMWVNISWHKMEHSGRYEMVVYIT